MRTETNEFTNDEETYINPYTKTLETVCVCGHRIGKHLYSYEAEEFEGCQVCLTCPSHDAFYVKD